MYVKVELNSYDALKNMLWGDNVKYTLNKIEDAGLEDEFYEYIESLFSEDLAEDTTINDYIAYEFSETEFINQNKTIDYIDSLAELLDYSEDGAYRVIKLAMEDNTDKDLWEYIQENFYNETLQEVFDDIEDLYITDYIKLKSIKSMDKLKEFADDDDILKDANFEELQEEYKDEYLSVVFDNL